MKKDKPKKIFRMHKEKDLEGGWFDTSTGKYMFDCACCLKRVPYAEKTRTKGIINSDGFQIVNVALLDKGFKTTPHKCPHGNPCSGSRDRRKMNRADPFDIDCDQCRYLRYQEPSRSHHPMNHPNPLTKPELEADNRLTGHRSFIETGKRIHDSKKKGKEYVEKYLDRIGIKRITSEPVPEELLQTLEYRNDPHVSKENCNKGKLKKHPTWIEKSIHILK